MQSNLNLWRNDYNFEWVHPSEQLSYVYTSLLDSSSQVLISGPKFSGKKHLAFQIAKLRGAQFFLTSKLSDMEIIALYEKLKFDQVFAIWILDENLRIFSNDVLSRLKSLIHFQIPQISEDFFAEFIKLRLNRIHITFDDLSLKYILTRLPRSYNDVELFVKFLLKNASFNLKILKKFFDEV